MHDGSKVTTEKIASWTNLYPCIETVAGENNKIVAPRTVQRANYVPTTCISFRQIYIREWKY